jgi:hypothetical protein
MIFRTSICIHLTVFLWLAAPAAWPAELTRFDVARAGPEYIVTLDAVVTGKHRRLFQLVTDYDHWPQLNGAIRESEMIRSDEEFHHTVRSVTHACIMFFCRDIIHLQDIVELENVGIDARTVPDQSDFRQGTVRWRIEPLDQEHSHISVYAHLEPDFWIPPLIGPWIVKHVLRREAAETIESLERLAGLRLTTARLAGHDAVAGYRYLSRPENLNREILPYRQVKKWIGQPDRAG